jgi:PAS domain S-box-containing protein
MLDPIFPILFLLFISIALIALVAFSSWRQRSVPAAPALAFTAVTAAFWILLYAFEIRASSTNVALIWHTLKQAAQSLLFIGLIRFVLIYARRDWLMQRKYFALLAVEPLVTQVLYWTNPLHQAVYQGLTQADNGTFLMLTFTPGPYFWIQLFYYFLLVLICVTILSQEFSRAEGIIRTQVGLILAGICLPWSIEILQLLGIISWPFVDLTPFTFSLTGSLLLLALFRYQLLDLLPMAQMAVIQSISEGILILDNQERIIEVNPAARQLFGQQIGRQIADYLPEWPAERDPQQIELLELTLEVNDQVRHFELRCSPVYNRQQLIAQLLIFRDISERKMFEQYMELRTAELEAKVAAQISRIQAEQEKSSTILQSVTDAIGMSDATGRINFINNAFEKLTGFSAAELAGKPALYMLYERLPQVKWESLILTLREGRTWEGEVTLRRKSGPPYEARLFVSPVRDQENQLIGYVSSHRDISKEKQLETAQQRFITSI